VMWHDNKKTRSFLRSGGSVIYQMIRGRKLVYSHESTTKGAGLTACFPTIMFTNLGVEAVYTIGFDLGSSKRL
jgi:hypothetical protein